MSTTVTSAAPAQPTRPAVPWRRLGRLALALWRATPVHAGVYAMLFVCSQLFLLAALLLPWKLLTVMATGAVPGFVPAAWAGATVRELVWAFAVGAVFALLLYGVSELVMARVARHGSGGILLSNDKVVLFDRYDRHAAGLYRYFLRCQAAALAVAVIAVCLAWLYPLVLCGLAVYLVLGAVFVYRVRPRFAATAPDPGLTPGLMGNAWWGAGFIFVVGWVVWDYLHSTLPPLWQVFVCLLMLRQALVLTAFMYQSQRLFTAEVSKAEALFLRDVVWQPAQVAAHDLMDWAEPTRRQAWVREALVGHAGLAADAVVKVVECTPAENARVLFVVAVCMPSTPAEAVVPEEASEESGGESEGGSGPQRAFLLKLFHEARKDRAQHEQDVLQHAQPHWPGPALLAAPKVQGLQCLVYGWDAGAQVLAGRERSASYVGLREAFLACEPPTDLVERYGRSRPHLADRLAALNLQRLSALAPPGGEQVWAQLQAVWQPLCEAVRALPGQVVLPTLTNYRVDRVCGVPLVRNWMHWLWEPVGCGWPVKTADDVFEAALAKALATRPELATVQAGQMRLAAVAYEFERHWRLRSFKDAVALADALLAAAQDVLTPTAPAAAPLPAVALQAEPSEALA